MFPSYCNSQQRSCAYNMEFLLIFTEIFERSDSPRTVLDFIEKKKSLSRYDDFACEKSDFRHDPIHIKVIVKDRSCIFGLLIVQLYHVLKTRPSELINNISLAALSDSGHQKWFSAPAFFPLYKIAYYFSIHITSKSHALFADIIQKVL